jgi:hypothetical protein
VTTRTVAERTGDIRRLLAASCEVYARRAELVPAIVQSTGLSPEGVDFGFQSLERDARDEDLLRLVATAGNAPRVHVVLSANVFIAPLRALALARATSPVVTMRPSPRDPVLVRALVDAARDPALAIVEEREVASMAEGEVHVYGRDATIASVRARVCPGVHVRGHGAGLGIAVITRAAAADLAADALARDVVAFDQRGCLSPRMAFVEGDLARATHVGEVLHEKLLDWGRRVPRGALSPDEASDAVRWRDAAAFAGEVWAGPGHAVALGATDAALGVPPPGRHVLVIAAPTLDHVPALMAPLARFVVALGSDAPAAVARYAPDHVRIAPLGWMQRPPLDGPVDLRPG